MPRQTRNPHRTILFVLLPVLSALSCLSGEEAPPGSITVAYNHVAGESGSELESGGGFSAFIRFNDQVILFDSGGERGILMRNLEVLDVDPADLDAVVISHNHWDHVYGIPGIAAAAGSDLPVYVPASAAETLEQQNPRAGIVAVKKPTRIAPKAWVVGPLEIRYRGKPISEQALVLEAEGGLVVVVGCSHPGIVTVIEAVREQFGDGKIALVAGGMHLRMTSATEIEVIAGQLVKLGVSRLAPSHCTGDQAIEIFRRHWPETVSRLDLGDTLSF